MFDTFFHHSSDYLLQAVRVKEVPDLYFPISHSSVEITEHPWRSANRVIWFAHSSINANIGNAVVSVSMPLRLPDAVTDAILNYLIDL